MITDSGEFWAQCTRVVLHHLSLASTHERLSRVAFISLPTGLVRVIVPIGTSGVVYCGTRVEPGCVITHGPGVGLHERLLGPCHLRDIVLPVRFFERYGAAIVGRTVAFPASFRLWRPVAASLRRLIALHASGTRIAEAQPARAADAEAARGLEQELIETLIECLHGAPAATDVVRPPRHTEVASRFEEALRDRLETSASLGEICTHLNVSGRSLRACCHAYSGYRPQSVYSTAPHAAGSPRAAKHRRFGNGDRLAGRPALRFQGIGSLLK